MDIPKIHVRLDLLEASKELLVGFSLLPVALRDRSLYAS